MKKIVLYLFVSLIVSFIISCKNEKEKRMEKQRSMLIGTWKLTDYQDNYKPKNPKEQQELLLQRENMKRMTLIINEDNTYFRNLDSLSESGLWKTNNFGITFTVKNAQGAEQTTRMGLDDLSETRMQLRITDNSIITTLIFEKQKFGLN